MMPLSNDFILMNCKSVVLSVDLDNRILIADWAKSIELEDWELTFDLMAQVAFNNKLSKAIGLVQNTSYTHELAAQLHNFSSDYHKLTHAGLHFFAFVGADEADIEGKEALSHELIPNATIEWFTDTEKAKAWLVSC